MALENMSLPLGATLTAAGGTATVFTNDGQTVTNGKHLIVPADTSYVTRRSITAKVRNAAVQSDGSYSKTKREMQFVAPFVLASGKTSFNVIRISLEIHPEAEATLRSQLLSAGALLFSDSDAAEFWATGSLS